MTSLLTNTLPKMLSDSPHANDPDLPTGTVVPGTGDDAPLIRNCTTGEAPNARLRACSPKLSPREKRGLIYPYYAGFSEQFVAAAIDGLGVTHGSRILDPWNGSGTTTYVAALRNIESHGYDLNPALVEIARARSATLSDLQRAQETWQRLALPAGIGAAPAATQCVRLYHALHSRSSRQRIMSPAAASLLLTTLFKAMRFFSTHATTTNPSWYSSRALDNRPIPFENIYAIAAHLFDEMINYHSSMAMFVQRSPTVRKLNFGARNSSSLRFDLILTSPPYLTRLDYVKATLPELTLLTQLRGLDINLLRSQMMGSPLVGSTAPRTIRSWGPTAIKLLNDVASHSSKASSTYYLRFYQKYFHRLAISARNIARLLKPSGHLCMVVQDSYYKEIHIDLAKIAIEILETAGLRYVTRVNYHSDKSIAVINSRAHKAGRSATESAIVLENLGA